MRENLSIEVYRRSDLEILGYCIMHWLSGNLPWMNILQNQDQVHQMKEKYAFFFSKLYLRIEILLIALKKDNEKCQRVC
jgi:hypothetical protein